MTDDILTYYWYDKCPKSNLKRSSADNKFNVSFSVSHISRILKDQFTYNVFRRKKNVTTEKFKDNIDTEKRITETLYL